MLVRRVAATVVAGALVLAGCSGSGDGGGTGGAVRLALNNTSASLSAVVAERKGFFTEEGLTVQSQVLTDITKIPPALGRQFDIGFGVQPLLIRAASQGLGIVMVSGNEFTSKAHPEIVLVARKGLDIKGPADLRGKRIAGPTLTGNIHLATLFWLKKHGVASTDITAVQVATPSMLDQLNSGLIDVAEMQQPFLQLAEGAGLKTVGYPFGEIADPCELSSWIANRGWADSHRDQIGRFRRALDKAGAFIKSNPQEARDILADFTKQPPDLVRNSPLPEFTTQATVAALQQWDAVLREVGNFTAQVNYADLVIT